MSELRKAAEMVLKAWDKWKGGPFEREMEFLRQALAQPEQEPVAWVYNGILHEFDPSEFATSEVKPLYTAPPKREWVGLTDAEYDELMLSGDWGGSLIQATQAKLKEKNGG